MTSYELVVTWRDNLSNGATRNSVVLHWSIYKNTQYKLVYRFKA